MPTLSNPSKMPGKASMLPASTCKRGAKLRTKDGTVCSHCYACKGRFVFANVQAAMRRQYDETMDALMYPDNGYAQAMAYEITQTGEDFRHFASGDFQSAAHVALVCEIARLSPSVRHWAASREYGYVAEYLRQGGTIPANLTIRMSADRIGRPAKDVGLPTATVDYNGDRCEAKTRGGHCGPCRKCWDASVSNVDYPLS